MTLLILSSDIHCHWELDLPEGDLGILAGDLTYHGMEDPEHMNKFQDWFKEQSKKFKYGLYMCMGNHDLFCYKATIEKKYPYLYKYLKQDELLDIAGLKIWFSPWSPRFGNWGFMKDEYGLADIYEKIPEELDILVSHSPAYGHCDYIRDQEINVGSKSLLDRLWNMKDPPKYLISGHVHPWSDQDKTSIIMTPTSETKCYNVSVCDDYYKLVNKPTVLEI